MKNEILSSLKKFAFIYLAASSCMAAAGPNDSAYVSARLGVRKFDGSGFDYGRLDSGKAMDFGAGYRWGIFGVEAGYVNLGSAGSDRVQYDSSLPISTVHHYGPKVEMHGWTAGATARIPLGNGWSIGARAGLFSWNYAYRENIVVPGNSTLYLLQKIQLNESGKDWYAGIGAGYDFSKNFEMGISLDHYAADPFGMKTEANVLSIKSEYRF